MPTRAPSLRLVLAAEPELGPGFGSGQGRGRGCSSGLGPVLFELEHTGAMRDPLRYPNPSAATVNRTTGAVRDPLRYQNNSAATIVRNHFL